MYIRVCIYIYIYIERERDIDMCEGALPSMARAGMIHLPLLMALLRRSAIQ